PIVIAKQAATLDVLSGGRLILGAGVGWSAEEFAALGVPFARRASRTKEYVDSMRTIWREDVASFQGEFVQFDGIRVNPKPMGGRTIPIVLGGNSDAALRRVAQWGDGWYGFNLDGTAEVAQRVGYVKRWCREAGRDASDLHLAVSLQDPHPRDIAVLATLGINELVIVEGPPTDPEQAADWVRDLADRWEPTQR
ncbi:MAG: TIGR03619 family F420-dependent LLM class oxidoreductase, partial [Actinomycetota bacterium]|nr:TIGR03619 family F420-dependent LLM class oxidoreductase [Actinomycetota bacterium]